jgi:hypothetical protein
MYSGAMEYLEEERDAWRPFEALGELPDDVLDLATPEDGPGHGWSARDLIGHLVAWQEAVLATARELAVGETSATMARVMREYGADPDGYNDRIRREWRAMATDEVRRRLREVAGEVRGYLTVVPETRWLKHPATMDFVTGNTTEHYAEHEDDLQAVLALAR